MVLFRVVDFKSNIKFSYLNALPPILQATIEEIERVTGLRSLLLIGGPIPARDGKIATHL